MAHSHEQESGESFESIIQALLTQVFLIIPIILHPIEDTLNAIASGEEHS